MVCWRSPDPRLGGPAMFPPRRPRASIGLAAFAAVASLLLAGGPASANRDDGGQQAAGQSSKVFGPDASPNGRSYGEWAATWWTWALAQPVAKSPIGDTTGAYCAGGQSGH